MSGFRKIASVLLVVGLFGAGFLLGTQYSQVEAGGHAQADRETLFAPFWETWDLIHSSYVDEVDDVALMEGALNGMMAALGDEHSFYMNPETFAIVNNDLAGEFEGIGATVRQNQETGALVIVDTLPDSPAEAAGLKSGDAIVQVDGVDITAMTQTEIISRIRGPAGTTVELGIVRPGESALVIIPITRARIQIDSVQAEVLDSGLVYIRLLQFGSQAAQDLHGILRELRVEDRPGLILDFRGNPGGFLSTAIDVASEFVEGGVVVRERFRDSERIYEASGNPTAPTIPMVILVDEGSASASELVAGALQDLGRATIIGTHTFGKGSVQTWRQLSNGGGVRVTIARWYTPGGRTIHEVGLTPDIEVAERLDERGEDLQLNTAIQYLAERVNALPQ